MGAVGVRRHSQQSTNLVARDRGLKPETSARALEALIDDEALRYAEASPIVRGTRELSHGLLRILTSEAVADACPFGRSVLGRSRRRFVEFLASALAQHARDRGSEFEVDEHSLANLVSQLEAWATELMLGRQDARRVRANIQFALAEELSSHLRAVSIHSANHSANPKGDVRVQ